MTFTFDDLKALREEGFTDDQIGSVLAQEDQSISDVLKEGFTLEQITSTISGQPIPEGFGQPTEEGFLRQAADIPVNIFKGGVTGVRMVTDVFGAANPISKSLAGVEDYMDTLLSAQAKQDQQEIARILKDAEDKGVLDQVMAGVEAFSVAPADTLANAFGTMIPVLATGLAGSVARLAPVAVKGVQLGVGAAMGTGMIKGEIYNSVYSELENQGLDPETSSKTASEAQAYGGKNLDQILLGAGLGAAAASTGAEKILTNVITKAGGKVTGGAIAKAIKGGITEAVPEAAQGGQEKLATNIALQREGFDVPTMRGVVAQATMEGIAGLGMGAAVGPLQPSLPDDVREQRDIERDAEKVARELSVDPNDTNARGIVNETNRLEQKIQNNQVLLNGMEPTSREHQRLSLEIAEDQKNLAALKGAVDKLSEPIAAAEAEQARLARQIAAPVEEEKPKGAIEKINEQKVDLDERAKRLGADSARQFNTQNVLRENLTEEEQSLLDDYSSLNTEIQNLSWRDAAQLSDEEFSIWEKPKFTEKAQQDQELTDLGKLLLAHDARGDTDKAGKIKEKIEASKRKSNWTIDSWKEKFDESKTQEEIDKINTENIDWNDSVDSLLETIDQKTKPAAPTEEAVTPPVEPTAAVEPAPIEPVAEAPAITTAPVEEVEFAELRNLMERRGQAQGKVKGVKFSKKDEARYNELLPKYRSKLLETITPETDPVVWKDIEGNDVKVSQKGTFYTIRDGRVRTGVAFQPEEFITDVSPQPVSAAVVESNNVPLPEGYTKQGELYVYRPTAAPTPVTTPPVAEAPDVAPAAEVAPATPKLVTTREKAETDFLSIDELTEVFHKASPKGTDKSQSKDNAVDFVKTNINQTIDWVRDVFGSAPEKVGFDPTDMKKWLKDAIIVRPVTQDEFTKGIIKKRGSLTTTGEERGKIDVSVLSPLESRLIALHEASHFLYHLDDTKVVPENVLRSIKNKKLMPDRFPNPGKDIKERFADAFTNWAFTKMHPEYANEFPALPKEFVSWIESETKSEPLDYISSVNKIRKQKAAAPTPTAPAVGSRIKLGKSPQTYTIEEVIPQSETEKELGKQYYSVRNEKTGEVQTVEAKDLKPVKAKGVRKMAAQTRNEEYMRLAQDPEANREQLQRMVDEAAKKAGYDITAYHGTRASKEDFDNIMRPSRIGALGPAIYLSPSKEGPAIYAGLDKKNGFIIEAYVKGKNLFQISHVNKSPEEYFQYFDPSGKLTDEQVQQKAIDAGYDGVYAMAGGIDNAGEIAVFNPSQIKSADPVTYDDAGNVIPLEERFQLTSPDIRREAATRVKDESLVVPEAERYTFEQAEAEARKLFGGMPEGFVIVNDSVDKEYEFKAGYEPETGDIILNLAYIRKGESVRNLIAHELGHYAAGDPEIRAKLQEFLDALPATTRAKLERFVERVYNDETGDVRLEEKQVRAFVQMLKAGDQRNAFQKILDAIKKWLNEKLGTNFQPTDMDAAAVLSGAINRFVSGEKIAREDGEMREARVERSEDVKKDIAIAEQIQSVVNNTISKMPQDQARDYNAFVNEGKSEAQIAEENNTSVSQVRTNIVRGKKAVGDAIKKAKIDTKAKPENAVLEWTTGAVKKYFTKEGDLPFGTFQNWVRRNAKLAREAEEARQATQDFYEGLRKLYKINKIKFILDGLSSIPPEDVAKFNDALAGEIPISDMPVEIQEPLTRMRQHIDAMSAELIATGQLPEYLEAKAMNNLGVYLTRSYKIFSDPKWINKIPQEKLTAARNFLYQQQSKTDPNFTIEDADRKLEQMLNDWAGESDMEGKRGGRLGAKDLSVMMTRSEVPKQLRDVMGENTNVIFNYANTIAKISRFVADQQFLDAVKKEGAGKFLFTKDAAPKGFNTLIAPEESRTMAPLSGLRTTPEIAKAFEEFGKAYDAKANPVLYAFGWLNAVGKANLTVGSLFTQARNLIGQPFFFLANGHADLRAINREVERIMKSKGLSKDKARNELVKMAAGEGLVNENAYAGELKEAFEQIGLKTFEDMDADEFSRQFVLLRLFKKGTQGAQKVYQKTDELGKLIGWLNETNRIQKMNPGMSREDAMSIASERTRNTYPTYSQGSEALRLFRRQPFFGPFATFFYETFRTTYWNVVYAFEDINSGTEAGKQEGIKRLAGTMAQIAIGAYLVNAISAMVSGIGDQEEEDVRRMLPPWAANASLVWFPKTKDGVYDFINFSSLNPYNALTDPFVRMMSGFAQGEDPTDIFIEAAGTFLAPFTSEQPVTAATIDALRNVTERGTKVYNEEDDLTTKTSKILLHIFGKAFTPGTIDRLRKRIIPAIYGETVGTRAPAPLKEIGAEFTGVRFENLDMRQAFQNKAWEFNKAQNDSERIFRDVATRRRRVTEEEQIEAYRRAEESRFENWQEMYRNYMAVRRAGASKQEAVRLMTDIKISKREASYIARGKYVPYEVSDEVKRRSKLNGNVVPLREIKAIAREMPRVLEDVK